MKPGEREMYDAWTDGYAVPSYDWTECTKPIVGGPGAQARFERRAVAARKIWKNDTITSSNVAWIAANQVYMLPLIIAVGKVQGAEKNLVGGQTALTEMELAEVQTIHRVNAIATIVQNRCNAEINRFNRIINENKDEMKAREHSIKTKMPNHRPRNNPVNLRTSY
ncbi:unnamed protein product [Blumeria hordei]|uniref:Uncharacterized protein n=1 Tax=Blumeria hordei TaxID=2867405 RepID=A0A383UZD2_BLUHO|nr:unnamed protein product [Blumeria hordei]SZF05682.1 unnamed protein product [Blumeria hordei]SZF05691.1 unnamed protein product [Blumeria hordei]